jgi:hypothetical protein
MPTRRPGPRRLPADLSADGPHPFEPTELAVFTQILGPYKKQVTELKDAVSSLRSENAHLKVQLKEAQLRMEQMRGEAMRMQQVRPQGPAWPCRACRAAAWKLCLELCRGASPVLA